MTRLSEEVMQDDLSELLRALGMGDHARPESPHEVMQQCIAKARTLAGEGDTLDVLARKYAELISQCEGLGKAQAELRKAAMEASRILSIALEHGRFL